jgi:hypothetical protein
MNKKEEINKIDNDSEGKTSNSDNVNENGWYDNSQKSGFAIKREKRTRNRPSKEERYSEERDELLKELEKKMGLTEEVRGVLLYDLEHNKELKEYLKEKIPEIRKLYKCGTWNYFVKQHTKEGEEISEICLLKSIFKNEKYKLISKRIVAERCEEKKQYNIIYFLKDLNINQYFK